MSAASPEKQKDHSARDASSADWLRSKTVLTLALEVNERERDELIAKQLSDAPTLAEQVRETLQTVDRINRFVSDPLPVSPSAAVRIGEAYGPYHVIRMLGAGAMGQVFLAKDVRIGRNVALKSLGSRWLGSTEARQGLLDEARAIGALSHHHIASLYDVYEDQQYLLLVMEYIAGRNGAAVVADGPMPLGHAVRLISQICDAVSYAHDRGVLHCDLKPANIQISLDGSAKVLDFGIARAKYTTNEAGEDAGSTPRIFGTPAYMSPERLRKGVMTVSGDVYSLGVTLFEFVTGRLPFDEENLAALTGAILFNASPPVSSIVPSCPRRLDDVVTRALAKDPRQRYQTARELGRDLQDVLRELDSEVVVSVPTSAPARTERQARSFLAISVFAIVVALTLFGFVTSTFYHSPLGLSVSEAESPIWWPLWGLRSLILPLAQIGFTVLILGVVGQVCRSIYAASTVLRRWFDQQSDRWIKWIRSVPDPVLPTTVLVAQVIALGLFWWRFSDLFRSFNDFILQSGPLGPLGRNFADEHTWYQRLLSLFVLGFGLCWYRLIRWGSQNRNSTTGTTVAAATVMMLFTFFLMVAPYRLLFQSKGERVSYQSRTCHVVGQRGTQLRLFCPQPGSAWNRLIDAQDPELVRTGMTEFIFSSVE